LAAAKARHQPAILSFFAEWAIPCREMRKTLADQRLRGYEQLEVDVTDETPDEQGIKDRFHVTTLPHVIVFDRNGKEVARIDRYLSADDFVRALPGGR
jgi:thiol:disulfide interchange protein DsbD